MAYTRCTISVLVLFDIVTIVFLTPNNKLNKKIIISLNAGEDGAVTIVLPGRMKQVQSLKKMQFGNMYEEFLKGSYFYPVHYF